MEVMPVGSGTDMPTMRTEARKETPESHRKCSDRNEGLGPAWNQDSTRGQKDTSERVIGESRSLEVTGHPQAKGHQSVLQGWLTRTASGTVPWVL